MSTIIRIDPLERNTAVANDKSTFVIPRGVYDLSTLKLWFLATINNGLVNEMSLPRDVETMIETLQIFINGKEIQTIESYYQIFRIIEDFNKDVTMHDSRCLLGNSYFIPPPNNQIYNVKDSLFCINKWLGFLDCKEVIDTNKIGEIRIVITWAPNNVLISRETNVDYTLKDVHMTISRSNDPAADVFEYDDFKSVLQYNQSYAQSTQMSVMGGKLDYVLATFLSPNYKTTEISRSTNLQGTSNCFRRGTYLNTRVFPTSLTWNFAVNNTNVINYNPLSSTFIEYMNSVFPHGACFFNVCMSRNGSVSTSSLEGMMQYIWATGVNVDIDVSDGASLEFKTFVTGDASNWDNLVLFIAKSTKTWV